MTANNAPGFQKFPNYEIDTQPLKGQLELWVNSALICRTMGAVEVLETNHAGALYVPRCDLDQSFLHHSDTRTYCPFKGEASYWSIEVSEQLSQDVLWFYATPYDEVANLADYAGVYVDRTDQALLDGVAWSATTDGQ